MPTCKDNNVDVVFGGLKLVGDAQVAVNIFLSQPDEFPTTIEKENIRLDFVQKKTTPNTFIHKNQS